MSVRSFFMNRCPERDSNPQGLLHQILSLARLPIPPSGRACNHALTKSVSLTGQCRTESTFSTRNQWNCFIAR